MLVTPGVYVMLVCVREQDVCVCVCTSFALNSEVIIYVYAAAAGAPDCCCCCCCMYRKEKNCLQKASTHTSVSAQLFIIPTYLLVYLLEFILYWFYLLLWLRVAVGSCLEDEIAASKFPFEASLCCTKTSRPRPSISPHVSLHTH